MKETKNSIFEAGKKVAFFAIKIGISTALIIWLLKQNRLDFSSLNSISFDIDTIVLAFCAGAFVLFGLVLLALRIWVLIQFKRFSITFKKALGITFMGSFLGIALPGLVGGDAMKALYLCSNVPERRMDALTAVFADRFFGLYSLFLLGTLALFVAWIGDCIPLESNILLAAPLVVILLGLFMLLFARDAFYNGRIVQILYSLMPQILGRFVTALRGYLKAPKVIVIVIVLSILNHGFIVASFIIAAVILNDNLPIFAHFVINPLSMTMNMIPITPGGLGMTESVFSFLFQAAGSPNGAIVGLLGRCIQYGVFILTGSTAILIGKAKSSIGIIDGPNSQPIVTRETNT